MKKIESELKDARKPGKKVYLLEDVDYRATLWSGEENLRYEWIRSGMLTKIESGRIVNMTKFDC